MIESRFVARNKPWDGVGVKVDGALSSKEAIAQAGLDWRVDPRPITVDGRDVPDFVANVRSSDQKVLGVVSTRYKIVQNEDAFAFTDELLKHDVRYESAGAFAFGRKVWLLAKLPNFTLNGDDTELYLVFTNTHNGTGAVRVAVTPVRVVCNNALNLAFRSAARAWSVRHIGEDVMSRIHEAQSALDLTNVYIEGLQEQAAKLASIKVSQNTIDNALRKVFPVLHTVAVTPDVPAATLERAETIRGNFMACLHAPDLDNFRGTAWAAVNAMSDYITHSSPIRNAKDFDAHRCAKIFDGHPDIDRFTELMLAAA